ILWSLTGFTISFSVFGRTYELVHYLVWLAFIYVAVSSVITHLMGKPLKSLIFRQEMREADFRHSLIQLRDNANEIALSNGESAERVRLNQGFDAIRINWHQLLRREFILGLFSRPYFQTILRVPLFFSLPAYFMAGITLGGLMQLARAFGNVTQTLSYFIFSYRDLAELAAVGHRLDDLIITANAPALVDQAPRDIHRTAAQHNRLQTSDLMLLTPQGRPLANIPDRVIVAGERVMIEGPSGVGKSTLVSAICGIWPFGRGQIKTPTEPLMVLPQRSYMFSGSLAAAACYPYDPGSVNWDELLEVLVMIGLEHRLNLLNAQGEEALQGLSMGERQRLALARVFLHKPRWLILDEATSSLDRASEKRILGELLERLPEVTLLFATHRSASVLEPYSQWTLQPILSDSSADPIADPNDDSGEDAGPFGHVQA
ncbi:MAG: SbmA/BacA-like family transporter, partial [Pseudomonadota bacterium]